MLSLLFVCRRVIKFHLSPSHTYTSSTTPIDHDLVVKNQLTNEDRNRPRCDPRTAHHGDAAKRPHSVSLLCLFHAEWFKHWRAHFKRTLFLMVKEQRQAHCCAALPHIVCLNNLHVQNQGKTSAWIKSADAPHANNKQQHQLRTF